MSILLFKVLWYRTIDIDTAINITDCINFDAGRGLQIKNNVITLRLKNPMIQYNGTAILHKYIDDSFNIKFDDQDQIKVYVYYSEEPSDIEDSVWGNNTTEPSLSYLLGTYFVIEYGFDDDSKQTTIKLVCADKTYVMFNKLLAKYFGVLASSGTTTATTSNKLVDSSATFTNQDDIIPGMYVQNTTDNTSTYITAIDSATTLSVNDDIFASGEGYEIKWNAPSMLKKAIMFATEDVDGRYTGTGNESGVTYSVDSRLESESGYIQDERSDGSAFPPLSMSKVWKPVYEWVDEISQVENLNTTDELTGTLLYGKPFMYYIDENNKFHWIEMQDTVSSDNTIIIGTNTGVYSLKLTKSVFDTINFVVGRGGEDLYGNGTLNYYFEPTSKVKTLRMKVVGMTEIASDLIKQEISIGNLVENNTDGVFTYSGNRYDRSGNVTASWNNTEYTTDSTYNKALREEIRIRIKVKAQKIVSRLIGQRWKGTIEIKGSIITPGTMYQVTDYRVGLYNLIIRCVDVKHIINKDGWFTTLQLEEDQDAILTTSV